MVVTITIFLLDNLPIFYIFSIQSDQHDFLGDLVSVLCHQGDVNQGHVMSFHKVDENWFLNDDSRPIASAENPLQGNQMAETETVELSFFENNVQ